MSYQLVEQARALLEELARRERGRALERYRPSKVQAAFHAAPERFRLFLGANSSGKTTALVTEAISVALGREPWSGRILAAPPRRVMLCVSNFTHAAGEDLQALLEHYLPADELAGTDRLANGKIHKYRLRDRSVIKLMSYEQNPYEFEGAKWDWIGFNEPPPKQVFIPCVRGIAKSNGRIAFAMTPLGADAAWIYSDLFLKADDPGESIRLVTADMDAGDSFMEPSAMRDFKARLDPDEYEARVHGRFRHLMGRVYKQFSRERHVISGADAQDAVRRLVADPTCPKGCVVDPHDRRPFAIAWWLVDADGRIVFFDEWPHSRHHEMRSHHFAVDQYADLIRETEKTHGFEPAWRVMDPNYGIQRRVVSDESIRDKFDSLGLYFDTTVDDSLVEGHVAVKERLNAGTLLVMPECKNLIHAFENYVWADAGAEDAVAKEKPADLGKDYADCVRYCVMSRPGYFNPQDQPAMTGLDGAELTPDA